MIAAILIAIFFLALGLYDGHRNARAGKTWYGMTTRAGNVAMDIKDDQSKFRFIKKQKATSTKYTAGEWLVGDILGSVAFLDNNFDRQARCEIIQTDDEMHWDKITEMAEYFVRELKSSTSTFKNNKNKR